MPEETAFLAKTKAIAQSRATQRAAGIGGVSGATLAIVYQLFVSQAQYAADKQEARERSAASWREIKTLENDLAAARMEIVRLQARAITP